MNIKDLKFEIYCTTCDQAVGYTDKEFRAGEMMLAPDITNPDGSQAKAGAMIMGCTCRISSDRVVLRRFESRKNKKRITP